MPIIIQETEVQVAPQGGGRGAEGGQPARPERDGSEHVVPLRPADVERITRFLRERLARIRAD